MTLNVTKNQHYIPKFYLKGFCIEGLNSSSFVWCYDKRHAKGQLLKQQKSIKAICTDEFYYKQTRNGDDILEKGFQKIESKIAPIIKNIKERIERKETPLSEKEKGELAFMVGFFATKIPSFRTSLQKAYQWGIDKTFEYMKSNPTDEKESLLIKDIPEDSIIAESWCSLKPMIEMTNLLEKSILTKSFEFLLACNSKFVTSDNPVILYENHPNIGIANPLSHVFFPLQKDIGLLCKPNSKDMNIKQLAKKEVKKINEKIISKADRYIISDRNSENIAKLVKQYKNSGGSKNTIFENSNSLIYTPNY